MEYVWNRNCRRDVHGQGKYEGMRRNTKAMERPLICLKKKKTHFYDRRVRPYRRIRRATIVSLFLFALTNGRLGVMSASRNLLKRLITYSNRSRIGELLVMSMTLIKGGRDRSELTTSPRNAFTHFFYNHLSCL